MDLLPYIKMSDAKLTSLVREMRELLKEIEQDPDAFHEDVTTYAWKDIRGAERVLAMSDPQRKELYDLAVQIESDLKDVQKAQERWANKCNAFEERVKALGL